MNTPRFFLPFLIAGSFLATITTAVQAQEQFDNQSIRFAEDTIVEFEFIESHGAYQSTFGVINLETGEKTPLIQEVKPSDTPQNVEVPSTYVDDAGRAADFLGTPGNTVTQPIAEFEFAANVPYALYLESFLNGTSEEVFFSIDSRNPNNTQRVQFSGPLADLGNGGVTLNWDDTGSLLVMQPEEDRDFDDFLIRVGGHIACPPFAQSYDPTPDEQTPAAPSSPDKPTSITPQSMTPEMTPEMTPAGMGDRVAMATSSCQTVGAE